MYLEYLRARRLFVWYALILIAIALFMAAGGAFGNHVHVHGLSSLGTIAVPIDALAGVAGMCAIAFATGLAGSLNRNTQNAHFLFVRPVARLRMAWETVASDVAAIVAASAFAFVVALLAALGVLHEHAHFVWSADALAMFSLAIGAGVMWYAMLQAFSSWAVRRSGAFVGGGCALFALAIPLAHATFLGALRNVFAAILYIDPLAYFTSVSASDSGDVAIGAQVFVASAATRAVLVWLLAAVALVVATFNWKRVEI